MNKLSTLPNLTNKKLRESWLASLPLAHHEELAKVLQQALILLSKAVIPPHQRYISLEAIADPFTSLLNDIKLQQHSATFPASEKHRQRIEKYQSILQLMSEGYLMTLKSLAAHGHDGRESAFFTVAIFRAMQLNLASQHLSYTSYHQPDELTWANLNKLYHLAFSKNIHLEYVIANPLDLVKAENIENLYKQTLLLALANPFQLPSTLTAKLTSTLVYWAQYCNLYDVETPTCHQGMFAIKLNGATPPKPVKECDLSIGYGLYFDTANLLVRLKQIITKPGMQLLSNDVRELINEHPMTYIKRIYRSWGKLSKRTFPRHNTQTHIHLTMGFNATHNMLNLRQELSGSRIELQPVRSIDPPHFHSKSVLTNDGRGGYPDMLNFDELITTNSIAHKQIGDISSKFQQQRRSTQPIPRLEAKIIDESAGGYRLSLSHKKSLSINVGSLVCCHCDPKEISLFTLCVIRWMKESSQTFSFGIEVISPFAEAVSMVEINEQDKTTANIPALLLPQIVSLKRRATLIVSRSTVVRPATEYFLNTASGKKRITLKEATESTGTFSRFNYSAELDIDTTIAQG